MVKRALISLKILLLAKTARYDRIINELYHLYKVSLIKTGLMFYLNTGTQ
jgi:hypothetical protein